ncbi:MAG: exopolysaccharide biosynthesis polyprenyl glycosylphosphotransferase [Aquificae bacterium]|nr:exopolysaccharide biosynthesis polyprenyl glycosylphosphotransferase [Aquificota bacterium]
MPVWKRLFDVTFSLLVLLLTLPLMLFIALAIKLTDGGPVFYTQERVGYRGRRFKILKFRTMYPDADERLKEILKRDPKAREEWERYRKIKNDPRVTCVGRFLRRSSLDELPQFINVLKGEMSVVGPRPYLPEELELMGSYRDAILSVKPGITGKWQVEGRNELDFNERLKLDAEYAKRLSFVEDLKIILKTVKVVLTGRGAY